MLLLYGAMTAFLQDRAQIAQRQLNDTKELTILIVGLSVVTIVYLLLKSMGFDHRAHRPKTLIGTIIELTIWGLLIYIGSRCR